MGTKWKGGKLLMDYRTIVEKHPDRYVIAAVAERVEKTILFLAGKFFKPIAKASMRQKKN